MGASMAARVSILIISLVVLFLVPILATVPTVPPDPTFMPTPEWATAHTDPEVLKMYPEAFHLAVSAQDWANINDWLTRILEHKKAFARGNRYENFAILIIVDLLDPFRLAAMALVVILTGPLGAGRGLLSAIARSMAFSGAANVAATAVTTLLIPTLFSGED